MTTGEKIAAQRRKAGLSQETLAEQLGISRQAVSRWETNESLPDTERIIQLSRIFGVPTDYLLLEEQELSESTGSPAEPASPAGVSTETPSAPPAPETTAARLFRWCGVCLAGGGTILTLAPILQDVYRCLRLYDWYESFGEHMSFALRSSWSDSTLPLGLLLMLVGILLLAVDHFLRKRP